VPGGRPRGEKNEGKAEVNSGDVGPDVLLCWAGARGGEKKGKRNRRTGRKEERGFHHTRCYLLLCDRWVRERTFLLQKGRKGGGEGDVFPSFSFSLPKEKSLLKRGGLKLKGRFSSSLDSVYLRGEDRKNRRREDVSLYPVCRRSEAPR